MNPLTIHLDSPRRVPVRKALKTDRVLKFGQDTIRVHSLILDKSKPLRDLAKAQGAKITYNIDQLKREHGLLSTTGLRHAIDFMYGQPLDVGLHELYDVFAAAHALDLPDLLDALRAELIKLSRDPSKALFALDLAYNYLSPPAEETARNAALHLATVCKQQWCAELTPVAFSALIEEASHLCPIALDVDVYVCTILDWLAANRKEITLARSLLTHIDLRDATPSQNSRIRNRVISLKLIEQMGGSLSLAMSSHSGGDGASDGLGSLRDLIGSPLTSRRSSLLSRGCHSTPFSPSLSERTMEPGLALEAEERVMFYDFGVIPLPMPDEDGPIEVTVSMDLDNDEDLFEHLRTLNISFAFDTRPI